MTSAGFNRRMRKTACPVVWKEHGAKSPCSHPITSDVVDAVLVFEGAWSVARCARKRGLPAGEPRPARLML
jgi:hypothetical protein